MSVRKTSEILGVDDEAVVEAVRAAVDGNLYSLVEFDSESFNPLYVSEQTVAMYESEAHMNDHFGEIHDYVNLDFTEIQLFTQDLLPVASRVRYMTTALDVMTLVRLYVDDRNGFFLALPPETPVEPVVAAVANAIDTD